MSIPEERYADITRPGSTTGGVPAEIRELQRRLDAHIGKGGNAHAIASPEEAGFMSQSDKEKLDTVQNGATQNQTDDYLLSLANATGELPIARVDGLQEEIDRISGDSAAQLREDLANDVEGNLGAHLVAFPAPEGESWNVADLANPAKGAAMVARAPICVDSIADLLALPEGQRKEGLQYLVKGYHEGSDIGGGAFYYDEARPKSEHDGVTILSLTVPFGVLEGFLTGAGETDPSGAGCFVRMAELISADDCGAVGDGIADDAASLGALGRLTSVPRAPVRRRHLIRSPIYITGHLPFEGGKIIVDFITGKSDGVRYDPAVVLNASSTPGIDIQCLPSSQTSGIRLTGGAIRLGGVARIHSPYGTALYNVAADNSVDLISDIIEITDSLRSDDSTALGGVDLNNLTSPRIGLVISRGCGGKAVRLSGCIGSDIDTVDTEGTRNQQNSVYLARGSRNRIGLVRSRDSYNPIKFSRSERGSWVDEVDIITPPGGTTGYAYGALFQGASECRIVSGRIVSDGGFTVRLEVHPAVEGDPLAGADNANNELGSELTVVNLNPGSQALYSVTSPAGAYDSYGINIRCNIVGSSTLSGISGLDVDGKVSGGTHTVQNCDGGRMKWSGTAIPLTIRTSEISLQDCHGLSVSAPTASISVMGGRYDSITVGSAGSIVGACFHADALAISPIRARLANYSSYSIEPTGASIESGGFVQLTP